MDAEKLRVARDKLTRVFRYLEALNQHRNPAKRQIHEQPWSFRLRDLPEHSSIRRGAAKTSALKATTYVPNCMGRDKTIFKRSPR